jgi:hypothetical protein
MLDLLDAELFRHARPWLHGERFSAVALPADAVPLGARFRAPGTQPAEPWV